MSVQPPLLLRRQHGWRVYGTVWRGAFTGTIKASNARDAELQMRRNGFVPTGIMFLHEGRP